MTSIITDNLKVCYHCGSVRDIEVHHCIHGTAGRKLATKYHLVVGLCPECHRGTYGVHGKNGAYLDRQLKEIAQKKWEEKYGTREEWLAVFGRNYL